MGIVVFEVISQTPCDDFRTERMEKPTHLEAEKNRHAYTLSCYDVLSLREMCSFRVVRLLNTQGINDGAPQMDAMNNGEADQAPPLVTPVVPFNVHEGGVVT